MDKSIAGVAIPDTRLVREATELIQETEPPLLFNHSVRVYLFGSLAGKRRRLSFDPELLYVGAIFHDIGLVSGHRSATERFEVDGANAARAFLLKRQVPREAAEMVWTAIALHTTPGIPEHMCPEIALVTAGVEMDVLGIGFSQFTEQERAEIVAAHPRGPDFKNNIIRAFYDGIKHRPQTTFGNVKADVLARMDPGFRRIDFCEVILGSNWPE